MSRNIKEIGKELMGKSLNSFHRKTGLTQLEENNKMQDGILDGILSQVDDAYIEKTEQSNVIHLDGSGDGVVVLDSIEGNTLVNCLVHGVNYSNWYTYYCGYKDNLGIYLRRGTKYLVQGGSSSSTDLRLEKEFISTLKDNTTYTFIFNVDIIESVSKEFWVSFNGGYTTSEFSVTSGINKVLITTINPVYFQMYSVSDKQDVNADVSIRISNMIMIEGDWVNKETPNYFEGLQSSFEEQVEDNKYKIEILSKNRNLVDVSSFKQQMSADIEVTMDKDNIITVKGKRDSTVEAISNPRATDIKVFLEKGKIYIGSYETDGACGSSHGIDTVEMFWMLDGLTGEYYNLNTKQKSFTVRTTGWYYARFDVNKGDATHKFWNIQLTQGSNNMEYKPQELNKIKLLLDEPLYKGNKVCIKNGCLGYWKHMNKIVLDGSENWNTAWSGFDNDIIKTFHLEIEDKAQSGNSFCDKFRLATIVGSPTTEFYTTMDGGRKEFAIGIMRTKLTTQNVEGFKTWLSNNPVTVVYELAEPLFIPLTNEYGEPIILEGYENGTIYIDSTIVPTTTVRYTPKMESFKTLKEVNNNNIMLTNDVNDNIIPYMMDVDMMILEKEMALMSHKYKLRRIGESDMTSMQKRTQDMLERLIKGKTLTEQECKTRVTTYLNAGKITDAQAEELNFLIDEIYA